MAELSVVIVSYRTPDHLRRCLETLGRDKVRREREILVVDNESGDESPDVARDVADRIQNAADRPTWFSHSRDWLSWIPRLTA